MPVVFGVVVIISVSVGSCGIVVAVVYYNHVVVALPGVVVVLLSLLLFNKITKNF